MPPQISRTSRKTGVKNVFILELVFTTRVVVIILEKFHVSLLNFCGNKKIVYIDYMNIVYIKVVWVRQTLVRRF